MPDVVRIANASGYWGDDPEALARQVRGGAIDDLTLDFLAEITMVILERQRALLNPCVTGRLKAFAVATRDNTPKNDDAPCIVEISRLSIEARSLGVWTLKRFGSHARS